MTLIAPVAGLPIAGRCKKSVDGRSLCLRILVRPTDHHKNSARMAGKV